MATESDEIRCETLFIIKEPEVQRHLLLLSSGGYPDDASPFVAILVSYFSSASSKASLASISSDSATARREKRASPSSSDATSRSLGIHRILLIRLLPLLSHLLQKRGRGCGTQLYL